MTGKVLPVRACVRARGPASGSKSPAASPPWTECLDIFSPLPGNSEVTSQFERESSSEMKIAASLTSMAAWVPVRQSALATPPSVREITEVFVLRSTQEAASDQSPHVGPMSSAGILSSADLPRTVRSGIILRRPAAKPLKWREFICVQPLMDSLQNYLAIAPTLNRNC